MHVLGEFAIQNTVYLSDTSTVQLLFSRGANVGAAGDLTLHEATQVHHTSIVQMLLKKEADVHAMEMLHC